MSDDDFVRLDEAEATIHVSGVGFPEARRLKVLYQQRRGLDLPYDGPPYVASSSMLIFGRVAFGIGAILSIFGLILLRMETSDAQAAMGMKLYPLVATWVGGAALSLGGFMWMLGAIEQRLIEIRGLVLRRFLSAGIVE